MTQEEADNKILKIIEESSMKTHEIMRERRRKGIKTWGLDGPKIEECDKIERIAKEKIKKIIEQIDE